MNLSRLPTLHTAGLDPSALTTKPRVALWRSRRERAVWLRDLRRAELSQALPAVSYVASLLVDRGEVLAAALHVEGRVRRRQAAEGAAAAAKGAMGEEGDGEGQGEEEEEATVSEEQTATADEGAAVANSWGEEEEVGTLGVAGAGKKGRGKWGGGEAGWGGQRGRRAAAVAGVAALTSRMGHEDGMDD